MAEALGVATGVAGLVALGLQVTGGIMSYIDGVKAREEDLAAASTGVRHMQSSIQVLQNGISNLSNRHQAASSAAVSAIQACKEELGGLDDLLQKLRDVPTQDKTFQGSIRQKKKRLSYPFHRPSFDRLQRRLDGANDVLQTAIQALNLIVVSAIDRSVSVVTSNVDKISAMQTSLHTSSTKVSSIVQDLHTILLRKEDVQSIMTEIQRTMDAVAAGSQKAELQHTALTDLISVSLVDKTSQSSFGRSDMQRIDAKLDRLERQLRNVMGWQNSRDLIRSQRVGHPQSRLPQAIIHKEQN